MIVDFGFFVTGVNKLSKDKENENTSGIISNIIYTKVFIFLVTLPFFLIVYWFITSNKIEWDIYILSLIIPFASVLNLSWSLQGLYKIKEWSILTIFGQIVYILIIYIFIKEPSDVIYINLFYGFGLLSTGIASLAYLKKKFELSFGKVYTLLIFQEIKEGYHFFLSNIGNYTSMYFIGPLIGLLISYQMAGVYSIVEKIYNLARKPFAIYQTFMLPKISQEIQIQKNKAKKTVKKTYLFVVIFIAIETLILLLFKESIILYFTDMNLYLLKKMINYSLVGIVIVIINCPISLYLTALDKKKEIMRISLLAPAFGVIVGILLITKYGILGSIFTLIFIEIFFSLGLLLAFKKIKGYKD